MNCEKIKEQNRKTEMKLPKTNFEVFVVSVEEVNRVELRGNAISNRFVIADLIAADCRRGGANGECGEKL